MGMPNKGRISCAFYNSLSRWNASTLATVRCSMRVGRKSPKEYFKAFAHFCIKTYCCWSFLHNFCHWSRVWSQNDFQISQQKMVSRCWVQTHMKQPAVRWHTTIIQVQRWTWQCHSVQVPTMATELAKSFQLVHPLTSEFRHRPRLTSFSNPAHCYVSHKSDTAKHDSPKYQPRSLVSARAFHTVRSIQTRGLRTRPSAKVGPKRTCFPRLFPSVLLNPHTTIRTPNLQFPRPIMLHLRDFAYGNLLRADVGIREKPTLLKSRRCP
jgi:hypothetical protein